MMRVPAAILLTMLVATPAMAVDVTSGSGAVVKNGSGLTVVNGDPCAGRMAAACLDRERDGLAGPSSDVGAVAEPVAQDTDPMDEYPEGEKGCSSSDCL